VDWDVEAQQLLRMCQAIRAVQLFNKKNISPLPDYCSLVTVHMYARGSDSGVFATCALTPAAG